MTNLDKDPATGGWAWRINIDAIQSSMGTLAQFDSGKRHQEEIQGRLVGGSGDRIGDDKDELGSYKGDVSAGSGAALGSYECGFWSTRIAPQGDCLHFSVGLPPVLTALIFCCLDFLGVLVLGRGPSTMAVRFSVHDDVRGSRECGNNYGNVEVVWHASMMGQKTSGQCGPAHPKCCPSPGCLFSDAVRRRGDLEVHPIPAPEGDRQALPEVRRQHHQGSGVRSQNDRPPRLVFGLVHVRFFLFCFTCYLSYFTSSCGMVQQS